MAGAKSSTSIRVNWQEFGVNRLSSSEVANLTLRPSKIVVNDFGAAPREEVKPKIYFIV